MEDKKNNRTEKIKKHIKEHKEAYIAGATGVAIGVCGTLIYCLATGKFNKVTVSATGIASSNGALNVLPRTTNNISVKFVDKRRTEPVKPCRELGTGITYDSQNDAAKALGTTPKHVSDHLRGKTDNINGVKLQRLKPVW